MADRTRFVSDMAGMLSPQARSRADSILARTWRASSAEPVVVIVPDLDGADPDDYATELFRLWGIGKNDKDNGVLMLVSLNDRKVVIRTGYGAEPYLPDVVCSRIIRNDIAPAFRQEDYETGIIDALEVMEASLTSDDARANLMSAHANDEGAGDFDGDAAFRFYLGICLLVNFCMLIVALFTYLNTRRQPTSVRYHALDQYRVIMLCIGIAGVGLPLIFYVVLYLMMRHIRLHKRLCPNCSTRMQRLGEDEDNNYLLPAQDTEEKLNSVDYDVWLCPKCHETDIIPYVNSRSNYVECPSCHGRTGVLQQRRTLIMPTASREGLEQLQYQCLNCNHHWNENRHLPRRQEPKVIIIPGGIGGGGGGGGFSGGSFGGGMTGGGGASGGW